MNGRPVDVQNDARPSAAARESSPVIRTRKKHLLTQVLFSVIFASGELYCFAVIFASGERDCFAVISACGG